MYKHVFGPVPSRRLGVSLGVDLVEAKTCNLNCIYCECGGNSKTFSERGSYVNLEEVKIELKNALKKIKPDFITFSGSGEPTLNSDIGKLINWVKENTDSKVAVITNSTLLHFDEVIEDILKADVIMPSLDAISEEVFVKVNRPHATLKSEDILKGLLKLSEKFKGKILLEIFIIEGVNDTPEELKLFAEFLKKLGIEAVQLNTLARPGAVDWIQPATFKRLKEIKKCFESFGINGVEIIKKYKNRDQIEKYSPDEEKLILNMLSKRAYSLEELCEMVGEKKEELHKYLEILEKEKKVEFLYTEGSFFLKKL
ncbi:radical SAM protein [uncultured Ilyobacter sp.]|uniref:radical SAM protein n=1 Tax=uncultured Ilyobacter sp. TaxID=544433 RepID=UPI002AA89446|nr:radical SAM protein [uncultured Ilyobacter sp.]